MISDQIILILLIVLSSALSLLIYLLICSDVVKQSQLKLDGKEISICELVAVIIYVTVVIILLRRFNQ